MAGFLLLFLFPLTAYADIGELVGGAIGLLGSAASGGIFGLVGSLGGALVKMFQTSRDRKFQEKKWAYESDMLDKQHKQATERGREETENEMKIIGQQGSWEGLGESIAHDLSISNTSQWVDNVRGLFRPFLTCCLIGVDVYLWHSLTSGIFGEKSSTVLAVLGKAKAVEMLVYMVYSHVFACSTAIVWWFGDRAFAPPGMKK